MLSRLGCIFVFYMNLLKIKLCPLMWRGLWFATVDGTKIVKKKKTRYQV